ncbi:RING finger protein unkempt [Trichinella pseudospiralis]
MTPTDSSSAIDSNYQFANEKSNHERYLEEFRVDPCALFKQHTCQQHRPYTCFYWHFANQRRRRCSLLTDGTFNYSSEEYCSKYDESTGTCPDDDHCPYLHRVYGDVERKYHLRYYKTTLCVYVTDSKGKCTKNGIHCPHAHGLDDIRQPVYDSREEEVQFGTNVDKVMDLSLENRDRLSFVIEDHAWDSEQFVLSYYKTEMCQKPPRLCRQGYACPYYHNSKDRRRSPTVHKYRSTACPAVKHGDEWSTPESCDSADLCIYCHTRTEQQFHPEIYKSNKCNDMIQHGYCPRGSFCAFAHTEGEICTLRTASSSNSNNNNNGSSSGCSKRRHSNSVNNSSNSSTGSTDCIIMNNSSRKGNADFGMKNQMTTTSSGRQPPVATLEIESQTRMNTNSPPTYSAVLMQRRNTMPTTRPVRRRQNCTNAVAFSYPKAPGFERDMQSPYRERACSGGGLGGEMVIVGKCKQPLQGLSEDVSQEVESFQSIRASTEILPRAASLSSSAAAAVANNQYEHMENLDALLGSLAEELNLNNDSLPTINENEERNIADALTLPFSNAYASSGFYSNYHPVSQVYGSNAGAAGGDWWTQNGIWYSDGTLSSSSSNINSVSFNPSPPVSIVACRFSSDFGRTFMSTGSPHSSGSLSAGNSHAFSYPDNNFSAKTTPDSSFNLFGQNSSYNDGIKLFPPLSPTVHEIPRLQRLDNHVQQQQYCGDVLRFGNVDLDECLLRTANSCAAWKHEAEEQRRRAEIAEQEKLMAIKERDNALSQLASMQLEMQMLCSKRAAATLNPEVLNACQLEQMRNNLQLQLNKVNQQLQLNGGPMCARCGRHVNNSVPSVNCPCRQQTNKQTNKQTNSSCVVLFSHLRSRFTRTDMHVCVRWLFVCFFSHR